MAEANFDKFWIATNNGPYFSHRPIAVETLKKVAGEAYRAGAASTGAGPASVPAHLLFAPFSGSHPHAGQCRICKHYVERIEDILDIRYHYEGCVLLSGVTPAPVPESQPACGKVITIIANVQGQPAILCDLSAGHEGSCSHTFPAQSIPSIEQALAEARRNVQPIIDKEKQGENITSAMLDFLMKGEGMSQSATFEWLLSRHRKLMEIEAGAVPESQPEHVCKPSCHNPCLLDDGKAGWRERATQKRAVPESVGEKCPTCGSIQADDRGLVDKYEDSGDRYQGLCDDKFHDRAPSQPSAAEDRAK